MDSEMMFGNGSDLALDTQMMSTSETNLLWTLTITTATVF